MALATELNEPEHQILLHDWFRRVRESQRLHYECEKHFNRLHLLLGVPAIVLSALVGTTVFAALRNGPSEGIVIVTGMLSVGAAVLTSLQTFLAHGTRAARHHAAGSRYGAIRRNLELLQTFPAADHNTMEVRFAAVKRAMDKQAENSPYVPSWIKRDVDRQLKSDQYRRVVEPVLVKQTRAEWATKHANEVAAGSASQVKV